MKIEEGKYYRTREGKKVGPMTPGMMTPSISEAYPWVSPDGYLYRGNGERYEGAKSPNTDLISEWREEEPEMDYATMNEVVAKLYQLIDAKHAEVEDFACQKDGEISEINALIEKIESQYPKPDEEEK